MGRYDDITGDRLRAELTRFARLVLRMEEEDVLLDRTHSVLRLLGELRQMVFAHEVRNTRRDQPPRPHPLTRMERLEERARGADPERRSTADTPDDDLVAAEPKDSFRVVREALEREREFLDQLTGLEEARPEGEADEAPDGGTEAADDEDSSP
jgi:hypothetical protein